MKTTWQGKRVNSHYQLQQPASGNEMMEQEARLKLMKVEGRSEGLTSMVVKG